MKRITALALSLLLALASLSPAVAQSLAPVPRIGVLRFAEVRRGEVNDRFVESLRQGLRELGYIEGKNIAVEWQMAEGRRERLPELAAQLVHLKVSVIVVSGTPAAEAARQATRKIPIVLASVADALGSGFVQSLAHPGGNITGISLEYPATTGKQLEVLRRSIPGLARVAFLGADGDPTSRLFVESMERAARPLGIRPQPLLVGSPEELDGAFAAMRRDQAGALIVQPVLAGSIRRIAELAMRHHLPTMSYRRDFAEAGIMLNYGPDQRESWRRAAIYVDKILRGAKPRDLPVGVPTRYELVVNLRAARALGLTIPPRVVARADGVIR
jgi:putative ABC transport system substrate-binding protein